ncbi:MAG: aminopeptidase, partial [Oceanicaulis sp.]
MRIILIVTAGALALGACSTRAATETVPDAAQSLQSVRPGAIEAHIRFLADDLMEGRKAGERGYDLAANYVEAQ